MRASLTSLDAASSFQLQLQLQLQPQLPCRRQLDKSCSQPAWYVEKSNQTSTVLYCPVHTVGSWVLFCLHTTYPSPPPPPYIHRSGQRCTVYRQFCCVTLLSRVLSPSYRHSLTLLSLSHSTLSTCLPACLPACLPHNKTLPSPPLLLLEK